MNQTRFCIQAPQKKLIQILKQYKQHQYVLATHSAELITTADPDVIHLVTWADGQSSVQQVDSNKVDDLRNVLGEIGVSFSDLFGYDRAIWVEGPTEEICFPIILEKLLKRVELGLIFVAVRNTGDFERKRDKAKLIWDIYEKLSSNALLLPSAVCFSFDREGRSEREIDDLKRQSRGRAHFTARLTYENYLLDIDAIAALLNHLPRHERNAVVTSEQVKEWLKREGSKFASGKEWSEETGDQSWLSNVHAPNLLKSLFNDLSGAGNTYEKTSHSKVLTEWLIENKPEVLTDLGKYVAELADATH
jgi:hypothetical protein